MRSQAAGRWRVGVEQATGSVDFDEYATTRWSRLVRTCVLLGAGTEEAEDLVQATLTKVWRSWRRVQGADDVDAYVHRILVNTFTDARRRRWTSERPSAMLPELGMPDVSDAVVLRDAVRRSMQQLSAEHRAVVVLRYYALLSEAQIAEALGLARGTVKSRLSRALQVLRRDPSLTTEGVE